ncbi:hypothetical protein OIU78_025680 [Salix suchowensis]|nr:hypothetical protein OIU78_025680 [Salix suchowensis]
MGACEAVVVNLLPWTNMLSYISNQAITIDNKPLPARHQHGGDMHISGTGSSFHKSSSTPHVKNFRSKQSNSRINQICIAQMCTPYILTLDRVEPEYAHLSSFIDRNEGIMEVLISFMIDRKKPPLLNAWVLVCPPDFLQFWAGYEISSKEIGNVNEAKTDPMQTILYMIVPEPCQQMPS